jgi:hypothetical protein
MAVFNKISAFVEALSEKKHDLGSDVLKIMLTNSAPIASNTVKANLTDISAGFGYTAGGTAVTITTSAQTSGLYKLIGSDVVFTASGGSIGPFRYAALYNDTATNDELIGWWDYGASITLLTGESLTVDLDPTNGILTVQ